MLPLPYALMRPGPVLDVLSVPETAWTATDDQLVSQARLNRAVDVLLSVTLGPAVHQVLLTLAPTV